MQRSHALLAPVQEPSLNESRYARLPSLGGQITKPAVQVCSKANACAIWRVSETIGYRPLVDGGSDYVRVFASEHFPCHLHTALGCCCCGSGRNCALAQ